MYFSIRINLFNFIMFLLQGNLHKIICHGCVLESPRRGGDSITHPQHMILWINNENYIFLSFLYERLISPIYVRWKSGVTSVWRCIRDS